MGDQADSLADMEKFSDNEGRIIWPAWRAELAWRAAFEFGDIGNAILEGTLLENDINAGDDTAKHQSILNALISRSRAATTEQSALNSNSKISMWNIGIGMCENWSGSLKSESADQQSADSNELSSPEVNCVT